MATQLIRLPQHLMDAVLASEIPGSCFPNTEGHPGIDFALMKLSQTEAAVAVSARDRMLSWDRWPFIGDRVFVLLLTAQREPDRRFLPRLLPDDLVTPLIADTIPVACGLLCGHDALELSSLLDAAKDQINDLPMKPQSRQPQTRQERRLREAALLLQRRFKPALEELHVEIARYGDTLLRSGLGPMINDLSHEGIIGDMLSVTAGDAPNYLLLRNAKPQQLASLGIEIKKACGIRFGVEWALEELVPYDTKPSWELSPDHISHIHRSGFAEFEPKAKAQLWRRTDPDMLEFESYVPAVGIERAMHRFVKGFDTKLLSDVDPLVRSILGFHKLLRIQPFGRTDRRVAGLLLNILMRQGGFPPMPLPLVMHRRYWEHAHMADIAHQQDQADILVAAMIPAVRESLILGMGMIDRLGKERQRLLGALSGTGSKQTNAKVVNDLLSHVVVRSLNGPDFDTAENPDRALLKLHAKGMVDRICVGDRYCWSLALTRDLAGGGQG
jgi:hypothetical protein